MFIFLFPAFSVQLLLFMRVCCVLLDQGLILYRRIATHLILLVVLKTLFKKA